MKNINKNQLTIRFAERNDLSSVVDIYNQAIRSKYITGDTQEFTVEERKAWFEKYDSNTYPIYIVKTNGQVIGYCTLSPYRPGRQAMSHVAEISYYLDSSMHGYGVGTALLEYVISDCTRLRIHSLLAILIDINLQSIGILKKFNFEKWGHLPGIIRIDGGSCGHLIYGLKITG